MTPEQLDALTRQIKNLSDSLAGEPPPTLTTRKAKAVRKTITEAYDQLRHVIEALDPIKHPGFMFDPSNPNVVGRIVGITMIAQDRKQLANVNVAKFYGAGVYAIYYKGDYPGYAAIRDKEHPIYVGKADPADPAAKTAHDQGDRLSNRLNDHRKNIVKATASLDIDDFEYRALVVQTGWQTAAENYLIDLFKPIWNSEIGICYGFGKHGDSPDTRANKRSPWDTLHHGRSWAHSDANMPDAKPQQQILAEIATHLAANPPLDTIDEILRRFLEEMRAVS